MSYDEIDSSFKNIIKLLRDSNFDVIDDYTDNPEICAIYIQTTKERVLEEANRLVVLMKNCIKPWVFGETEIDDGQEVPRVSIEAIWLPQKKKLHLVLYGFNNGGFS